MSNKDTYVPKDSIRRAIQEFLSRMASAFEDRTLNTYNPLSEGFITGKALKKVLDDLPTPITPKGSILFTNLPSVEDSDIGDMYNIKDGFISTAEFEGGADVAYEAGTNVVCCKYGGVKKWDAFSVPINYVSDSNPIGTILAFAGTTVPIGYLLCDGSEKKIALYPALAAVLGTSFGTASDSDYFVLPDLRGRTVMGVETGHTLGASENGALPNITGNIEIGGKLNSTFGILVNNGYGALKASNFSTASLPTTTTTTGNTKLKFDASLSNSIYTDSQTKVDPANVRINYIIKAK